MSDDEKKKIERRFLEDIKLHEMSIVRDDGVDRFIRFRRPQSSFYYFDVMTWPGHLMITGDCGTWVFQRLNDMFAFFRRENFGEPFYINEGYWSEKLIACSSRGRYTEGGPKTYSDDVFRAAVKRYFDGFVESMEEDADDEDQAAATARKEIRDELWQRIEDEILVAENEHDARENVSSFEHEDFEFSDFWEVDLTDWRFDFMWNLFAIVWAIGKYDEAKSTKSLTRKFPGVGERPVIHRLRDGSEALIRDVDTSA
jgi:hypothetical protein